MDTTVDPLLAFDLPWQAAIIIHDSSLKSKGGGNVLALLVQKARNSMTAGMEAATGKWTSACVVG